MDIFVFNPPNWTGLCIPARLLAQGDEQFGYCDHSKGL